MEIKISTKHILLLLNILSWIIFVGVCIDAAGYMFNTIYALYKPIVAEHFWKGNNFSALYAYDKGQFITQNILIIIVAVMKSMIFYLIIKMFWEKKFSLAKPFDPNVTAVVFMIAYLCLGAGLFSLWGVNYSAWLKKQGIPMPEIQNMGIGGADVLLFMAVVLIVIGHVFKKGTELQTESDLTV